MVLKIFENMWKLDCKYLVGFKLQVLELTVMNVWNVTNSKSVAVRNASFVETILFLVNRFKLGRKSEVMS